MKKNYILSVVVIIATSFNLVANNSKKITTCADAIQINQSNLPTNQSLVCGTTNDINNNTVLGTQSYLGGLESVYKFTPTTTGSYNISYSGVTYTGIFVFQGCPTTGGSSVGNVKSSSSSKNLNVTLTSGIEYFIVFDTWPSPASPCNGTFTITAPPEPCATPANQPSSLIFSSITSTSISGSFTAATSAPSGYLVVRSLSSSSPSPSNGTTYATGSTSLGTGTSVVSNSSSTTFTSSSLTGNTTYYYYIFSYNNSSCSGGPVYNSVNPLVNYETTCLVAPTASAGTNITSSSFTANWSSATSGVTNIFLYVATDSNFNNYLSGYNGLNVGTATSYTITGLSSSTTYYYKLLAVGSSCNSTLSTTISVTTNCTVETAPTQVQDFATFTGSAPAPVCWSEASGSLTSNSTLSGTTSNWLKKSGGFANANSSNVAAAVNLYGNSTNWLISNLIDLGNVPSLYRLKYKYAVTNYGGTSSVSTLSSHKVDVVVSTDGGITWSNSNIIKSYAGTGNYSNTGEEEIINLTNYSGVIKIAFVATCISSSDIDFHLDDVQVETIPTCVSPTALTTEIITPNSVILSWTENGSANLWDIELGSSGFTPTGTPTQANITSYPYTYYGLIPNSPYEYYVRANCGNNDLSAWAGPYSFTTSKIAPTNQITNLAAGSIGTTSIPLTWTAAEAGNQLPDGYLIKASSISLASISNPVDGTDPSNVTVFTSNEAIKKQTTGTSTGTSSFTGMIPGSMYHYKVYSYTNSGNYSIIFNTTNPATLSHATKPNSVSTTLSNVLLTTNSIGFDWSLPSGYISGSNEILIFAKANSSITGSPTADPSSYTANATFGNGSVFEADNEAYCIYKGDGTSINLTGLNSSTTYHFLIYAVVETANSNGSFSYSNATNVNRTTSCASISSYPYIEGYNNSSLPACYSAFASSTYASQKWEPVTSDSSNGSSTPSEGTHFLRMNYYNASTGYNPYYLLFPVFELGSAPKKVSFDLWMGANSGINNLVFQISNDNGTTWTDLQTFSANIANTSSSSPWQTGIEIDLNSYANQTVTFRLKATSNYGYNRCNIGFDNFKVDNATITYSSQSWSNTVGPSISDDVDILADLTLTSDLIMKNLNVATGVNLTVPPNITLTVTGDLTLNGKIIFKSNATGDGIFGPYTGLNVSGSGSIDVERYIGAKRAWRMLTSPVKGTSNNTIFENWQNNGTQATGTGVNLWGPSGTGLHSGPNYNILKYPTTASSSWISVTNTQTEVLFDGTKNNAFAVFATGPYTTSASNISSGSAATTLTTNGSLITGNQVYTNLPTDIHTIIGNPYPSPLNPATILTDNPNFNNIWVWDPSLSNSGGYITYDASIGWSNTNESYSLATMIQSGLAFFVKPSAIENFTIKESQKGTTVTPGTFDKSLATTNSVEQIRIALFKNNNSVWQNEDAVVAAFSPAGDNALTNKDAVKMFKGGENIAILQSDTSLTIEHRNVAIPTDVINLKVSSGVNAANYKLIIHTVDYAGLTPYLYDNVLNIYTQLPTDGSTIEYPFSFSNATAEAQRFSVVFTSGILNTVDFTSEQIEIYPNPAHDFVTINYPENIESIKYTMYNLMGQKVKEGTCSKDKNTFEINQLAKGIYNIEIRNQNIKTNKSLIIK